MKYLLDADWAISFLNGRVNAVELVSSLADEGFALSIITYGEIYEGLSGKPDSLRRFDQFDAFAASLDLISPDIEVARRYADIRSYLRSQGRLIPDNDLWIAATALARDLTVISRDQHFARIPGVKVYR